MRVANVRLLAALVVFLGASEYAWPQVPSREVRGELTIEAGKFLYGYTASLYDLSSRTEIERVEIDTTGYFTLHGQPSGTYSVRIRDDNNEMVREEFVTLSERNGPIRINLIGRPKPRSEGGTVSVTQLQHPPSNRAVQAFFSAKRFSESRQYARAAEELEKAVRISPEFAEAYTNMSAQHFRIGRYEEAAAESRRAMELSSPNPRDLCNLAVALWALQRFPEALQTAEKALAMDSAFVKAHFVIGSLLVADPATRAAGIRHLERAARDMPAAAQVLAQVLQASARDGR